MSQFGEVEYFKSLKYDALPAPNAALIIYKEEKAAQESLKRSPIRFRMGKVLAKQEEKEMGKTNAGKEEERAGSTPVSTTTRENVVPRGPVGAPFGLPPSQTQTQTRSLSTTHLPRPPPNPIRMPFDPPSGPLSGSPGLNDSRIFQIQTSPSRRHFRDQINSSPYHGSFALDSKQFGYEDLSRKVPAKGLACMDWRKEEKPWWVAKVERGREHQGIKPRRRLGELYEEAQAARKGAGGEKAKGDWRNGRGGGFRDEALPFG